MSFYNLIGTAPNQVPSNADLGDLAYQNSDSVNIAGGIATLDTGNIKRIENTTAISEVEPTLLLDFAKTKTLDPRITFTRASTGTYYDGKTYAKAEENLLLWSQEFDNDAWGKSSITALKNAGIAPDGSLSAQKLVPTLNTTVSYIQQTPPKTPANRLALIDLTTGAITSPVGTYDSISATDVGDGWWKIIATNNFYTISLYAKNAGYNFVGIQIYNVWRISVSETNTGTGGFAAADGQSGIFLWGVQVEERTSATVYTPTTDQPITNYIPVLQTASNNVARFDHDFITGESLGLLIEEQTTNLFAGNNNLSSAFAGSANKESFNINLPDGSLQNILLTNSSAFANLYRSIAATTNTSDMTVSFYVKKKTSGTAVLRTTAEGGNLNRSFYAFNINGDNWQRISFTKAYSGGTSTSRRFDIWADNGSDGDSRFFITKVQAEEKNFATSFIDSETTRANESLSMTGTNFSSWYRQDEGTVYSETFSPVDSISGIFNHNWTLNLDVNNWIGHISSASYGGSGNSLAIRQNNINQAGFTVGNKGTYNKVAYSFKANDSAGVATNEEVQTDSDVILPYPNGLTLGGSSFTTVNTRLTFIKKFAYYPKRLSNEELQEMTE